MISYKSLENISIQQLYKCFEAAFAGYEVQHTQAELEKMLKRRGFKAELSYGAFDDQKLVSFTFNGLGNYNGLLTAYDTGTGTIPEYRRRGIAAKVFEYAENDLKKHGIQQYLLEVLQHNPQAANLYKNAGFEVSREFDYFYQDKNELIFEPSKLLSLEKIKELKPSDIEAEQFCDFHHSWQNSTESILRYPQIFKLIGYYENHELTGYLVFDPTAGDITQIAVHTSHRRKGVGTTLINYAAQFISHKEVQLINSDSRDTVIPKFLESLNIPHRGKQFEMIKKL